MKIKLKENELVPIAIQGIENLKDLEKLSPHIEQMEHIVLLDDKILACSIS